MIGLAAHAPSTVYSYAQFFQAGASIDVVRNGNWLLPRIQTGGFYRKPQLYPWLGAAALAVTGVFDDFVFKLPTVLAAAGVAVLIYLLGCRWYGRRTGLLAGVLWVTGMQMSKLAYLATTDMLLTVGVTASIFCADRLVFHPVRGRARWVWAVGLWASIAFGALAKGWGLVNVVMVGGMLGLAAAFRPGFGAVETAGRAKVPVALRLVGRRWWKLAKATGLVWGLPAAAAGVAIFVAPAAMNSQWRQEVFIPEFWQRLTGQGAHAASASSVPPVLHLLYYGLPMSLFALASMVLLLAKRESWARPRAALAALREALSAGEHREANWKPALTTRRGLGALCRVVYECVTAMPRSWLSRRAPIHLPLYWVVTVVGLFSLSHGFRHDYLLPAYGAVALMGAWAIEEVCRRGRAGGPLVNALRHVFAGVAIAIGLVAVAGCAAYGARGLMPTFIQEHLRMPRLLARESVWGLYVAAAGGAALVAFAVWASLTWRLRRLAAGACIGMLGVMFLNTHFFSRHARTADGEVMRRFSFQAQRIIGSDSVAMFFTDRLTVDLYLGRFGRRIPPAEDGVRGLNASPARWLITCDRGLAELGAARHDPKGTFRFKSDLGRFSLATAPEQIGRVRLAGPPLLSQGLGRMYLIEVRRPVRPPGRRIRTGHVSDRRHGT